MSRASVAEVAASTAVIGLPHPLVIGGTTIAQREYCAARVVDDDGTEGVAYCLSRGAPMAELVDRVIAPAMIGLDSSDPSAAWQTAFRRTAIVGRVGLVRRALGLVDIAMWDVAGRRARVPVGELLGVSADPSPTMLVAAYPTAGRSAKSVIDEVLAHAEHGWPFVKISRIADEVLMRTIIRELSERLPSPTKLVVDASFGWPSADDAADEIQGWGDVDLAWVEDPLLPEDIDGYARLARAVDSPIGAGDEVTDPRVLRDLIEVAAIDVMRLDVVAIGGITPARDLIAWAGERGVRVSGHVYPEVTVHLGIEVETFDRSRSGNPYDPSPTFIVDGPTIASGLASRPLEPGLGFTLDSTVFRSFS